VSPREIDALVAQHWFGEPKPTKNSKWIRGGERMGVWRSDPVQGGGQVWVADPFSTDPAASARLEDKVWEEGYFDATRRCGTGEINAQVWKSGSDPHAPGFHGGAMEKNKPLAYALAALRAKGVQV
jgi:hypothetical protein